MGSIPEIEIMSQRWNDVMLKGKALWQLLPALTTIEIWGESQSSYDLIHSIRKHQEDISWAEILPSTCIPCIGNRYLLLHMEVLFSVLSYFGKWKLELGLLYSVRHGACPGTCLHLEWGGSGNCTLLHHTAAASF